MSLIVENISKTYKAGIWKTKEVPALKNVSFALPKGNVLALLGQNGAGKTTLIKCLLNFLHPDSGIITMDGNSIEHLLSDGQVGYMPER